jgi:hypothetical protein
VAAGVTAGFVDSHRIKPDPEKKIAICLATGDTVHTDFAFSMWEMFHRCYGLVTIINARSSLVPVSRYTLVNSAIEDHRAEKVFFIDTDLTFPPDALDRLLAHDVPIVAATYVMRRPPQIVLGFGVEDIEPGATGLYKMYRMPIGFSLISTEVFRNIPKPWFPVVWDEEKGNLIGEDYGFCDLAREAGYDLWCDLDLSHELGHEASQTLTWARR